MNGEWILDDFEQTLEDKRIEDEERLGNLERFIGLLKDLLEDTEDLTIKDYKDLIAEIKWNLEDL